MTLVRQPDDRALVAKAAGGDVDAFGELVRRHRDDAYGLALRLVADREVAADVTQEALIRAWRGLPRFRGDSSFGTWLYRITVNTAWSMRRHLVRYQVESIDPSHPGLSPEDPDHPERRGVTVDLRERLRAALDRLPPDSRTVVILKDVHGWSHAEIAEALDISVTAAKVRLHRARSRLQRELEELR